MAKADLSTLSYNELAALLRTKDKDWEAVYKEMQKRHYNTPIHISN